MKDEELIEQADRIHYTRWGEIEALMEKTDNPETKRRLKAIMVRKYHEEEYSAGIL